MYRIRFPRRKRSRNKISCRGNWRIIIIFWSYIKQRLTAKYLHFRGTGWILIDSYIDVLWHNKRYLITFTIYLNSKYLLFTLMDPQSHQREQRTLSTMQVVILSQIPVFCWSPPGFPQLFLSKDPPSQRRPSCRSSAVSWTPICIPDPDWPTVVCDK